MGLLGDLSAWLDNRKKVVGKHAEDLISGLLAPQLAAQMREDLLANSKEMMSQPLGEGSWDRWSPLALNIVSGIKVKGNPLQDAKGNVLAPLPEMADRYPQEVHPSLVWDKNKKQYYAAKTLGEEALAVKALRDAAQAEIDAGKWNPLFDVSKRGNVNPENYPLTGDTLKDALPKKQATTDKWKAQFDTPEVRARMQSAFDASKNDPGAANWYAMKQLEDQYVKELGPEAGRAAFKERFADAMAATTGGADPTSNLLTANYGNWVKANGGKFPDESFDLPYPIGGRYIAGNIDMFDKTLMQGNPLTASGQPKRFNFSANFMGHANRGTIDEQMMGLVDDTGKLKAPPGDSYGVIENILGDVAKQNGVNPMNFQDVAWHKGTKEGNPMINVVNEALWRTHRVTGLPQDEILRRYINAKTPLYGLLGASIGTPLLMPSEDYQ